MNKKNWDRPFHSRRTSPPGCNSLSKTQMIFSLQWSEGVLSFSHLSGNPHTGNRRRANHSPLHQQEENRSRKRLAPGSADPRRTTWKSRKDLQSQLQPESAVSRRLASITTGRRGLQDPVQKRVTLGFYHLIFFFFRMVPEVVIIKGNDWYNARIQRKTNVPEVRDSRRHGRIKKATWNWPTCQHEMTLTRRENTLIEQRVPWNETAWVEKLVKRKEVWRWKMSLAKGNWHKRLERQPSRDRTTVLRLLLRTDSRGSHKRWRKAMRKSVRGRTTIKFKHVVTRWTKIPTAILNTIKDYYFLKVQMH